MALIIIIESVFLCGGGLQRGLKGDAGAIRDKDRIVLCVV